MAAILELMGEGNPRPGAAEIAGRAGVSVRSVFRYFEDLDALHREAIARRTAELAPLVQVDPPDDPAERPAALVAARCRLWERIAPVARSAMSIHATSPTVARAVTERLALLRSQLDRWFPDLDPATRDALDASLSFAAWDHLVRHRGLSPAEARLRLQLVAGALVGSTSPDRPTGPPATPGAPDPPGRTS